MGYIAMWLVLGAFLGVAFVFAITTGGGPRRVGLDGNYGTVKRMVNRVRLIVRYVTLAAILVLFGAAMAYPVRDGLVENNSRNAVFVLLLVVVWGLAVTHMANAVQHLFYLNRDWRHLREMIQADADAETRCTVSAGNPVRPL